jgi:glycosyltransferase involved in cell wall biosynthesis
MYTLTVLIPAFNEARALPHLLRDISDQQCSRINVVKIVVLSDGSTDKTVAVAKKSALNDPRIVIKDFKDRKGKAERLNAAFLETTTDIVVVLDADIRLGSRTDLDLLVQPILAGTADLTSATVTPRNAKTFIQKVLAVSVTTKQRVYENYRHGSNIYTCHGRVRAFSHNLYKNLRFPHSYNEDSYSYLYCITNGYKYVFIPIVSVSYLLPSTLVDHVRQSVRFFQSQELLKKYFSTELLKKECTLPPLLLVRSFLQHYMKHPVLMTGYVLVTMYTFFSSKLKRVIPEYWDIAVSSK